jgi:hypothetical protein
LAENVLQLLDAQSLYACELVSKQWHRVIANGMLWRKFFERKVRSDPLWQGLANKRGWLVLLSFFSYIYYFLLLGRIFYLFQSIKQLVLF